MQIKKCISMVGMLGMLCCTTACIKYYDMVPPEFPQTTKRASIADTSAAYCRSKTVYDEFQTRAIFDALWLSDDVRSVYTHLYSSKRGYNQENTEEMLKRQLEENRHWVSMYVLADIRDKVYSSLSDAHALWSIYLTIDDAQKITPESVKEVDLEPEIRCFFGSSCNNFKSAYLVSFAIDEAMAQRIARNEYSTIALTLGSTDLECSMIWEKNGTHSPKKVADHEDFYWG